MLKYWTFQVKEDLISSLDEGPLGLVEKEKK